MALVFLCSCSDDIEEAVFASAQQLACAELRLGEPEHGVQLSTALTLQPGEEREVCQLVRLPDDLAFNWGEGVYSNGSHHALIHRTAYHETLPARARDGRVFDGTQVHDCAPTELWDVAGMLVIGHSKSTPENNTTPRDALPDDVAVPLRQGDYVLMNFHMHNPTAEPLNACFKANLNGIPKEQVRHEAGILSFYNPFIAVPALGRASARMACELPADLTLRNAVSHGHSRLTGYTARVLDGAPAQGGRMQHELYSTRLWQDPPPRTFDPALQLRRGQWIEFECDYTNTEPRDVAQGFATTDEMCMFFGLYWPKQPALELCGSDPELTKLRYIGTGTSSGREVADCLLRIPLDKHIYIGGGPATSQARFDAMSCLTQACPALSVELTAVAAACQRERFTTPECIQAVTVLAEATCD